MKENNVFDNVTWLEHKSVILDKTEVRLVEYSCMIKELWKDIDESIYILNDEIYF